MFQISICKIIVGQHANHGGTYKLYISYIVCRFGYCIKCVHMLLWAEHRVGTDQLACKKGTHFQKNRVLKYVYYFDIMCSWSIPTKINSLLNSCREVSFSSELMLCLWFMHQSHSGLHAQRDSYSRSTYWTLATCHSFSRTMFWFVQYFDDITWLFKIFKIINDKKHFSMYFYVHK